MSHCPHIALFSFHYKFHLIQARVFNRLIKTRTKCDAGHLFEGLSFRKQLYRKQTSVVSITVQGPVLRIEGRAN